MVPRRDTRLNMLSYNWLIKFLNLLNTKYTLGIFIDLSKAFDTVNHSMLLKKVELYSVTDRNHSWFKNYLSNRKQFIQINNEENTELETITRGVPQGSILGPLLSLLYVNDLKNTSNLLDPIMYVDYTNLFLTHKDISYLFETANLQLERINQWFISNKLSLNVSKKRVLIFSQTEQKGQYSAPFTKIKYK